MDDQLGISSLVRVVMEVAGEDFRKRADASLLERSLVDLQVVFGSLHIAGANPCAGEMTCQRCQTLQELPRGGAGNGGVKAEEFDEISQSGRPNEGRYHPPVIVDACNLLLRGWLVEQSDRESCGVDLGRQVAAR